MTTEDSWPPEGSHLERVSFDIDESHRGLQELVYQANDEGMPELVDFRTSGEIFLDDQWRRVVRYRYEAGTLLLEKFAKSSPSTLVETVEVASDLDVNEALQRAGDELRDEWTKGE